MQSQTEQKADLRIQRWLLQSKPKGPIGPHNFKLEEAEPPKLENGQILVRPSFISVDPYLRGWLVNELQEGHPMKSGMVGRVHSSKHEDFKKGQSVFCYGQWATLTQVDPADRKAQVLKLPEPEQLAVKPSAYLGALGMPGATAYFGLKEAAPFKKDDLVLVSSAAGAVGSMVGQLAKRWGARQVVGTTNTADKCKVAKEKFSYAECIDESRFNTHEKMRDELKRISPEGFDLFWDNTGGPVSWSFYDNPKKFARVALCGQISEYEKESRGMIPNPFKNCIYTSVKIHGFVIWDYYDRWQEFLDEVSPLVAQGDIKFEETEIRGFDKLPEALAGLFKGINTGKLIVNVE
jgi:NADPH-dependent curcumin reductase CurA